MKKRFTPLQRSLITACMMLYSTAYLNRLNLSAALGSVMTALDLTATRAGVLPSAFAITYAAGQMVNGALVDRLNPVRHMKIGLIGSAVCNLLMGLSNGFGMLLALCLMLGCTAMAEFWISFISLAPIKFSTEPERWASSSVMWSLDAGPVMSAVLSFLKKMAFS